MFVVASVFVVASWLYWQKLFLVAYSIEYHWLPTTSQRPHHFHWLRPRKGLFLQFLFLTGSGQSHLLLPSSPSCFCSCHPQMEAVGSSATATLERSITTQCRNPKDNCRLERLLWKLWTLSLKAGFKKKLINDLFQHIRAETEHALEARHTQHGSLLFLRLFIYTGCNRRNGPNFWRVFLMLNYIDITQNTYVPSWTVIEIMAK